MLPDPYLKRVHGFFAPIIEAIVAGNRLAGRGVRPAAPLTNDRIRSAAAVAAGPIIVMTPVEEPAT